MRGMRRTRRPKVEAWESEAREAGERLRQALALLLGQERNVLAGTENDEELVEALHVAKRTQESVLEWWEEWHVRTAKLRTSRGVALSAYRACLPPLTGAVDLYGQSLALLTLSPDLDAGDQNLAGRGIGVAKDVSLFALQLLDDTPALRSIDRAAIDATLKGLESRTAPMLALVEPIGERVRGLRSDGE